MSVVFHLLYEAIGVETRWENLEVYPWTLPSRANRERAAVSAPTRFRATFRSLVWLRGCKGDAAAAVEEVNVHQPL